MNAKQCKLIRKYVRETYPFMSAETLYERNAFGTHLVSPMCQRAFVRNIKKNIKKGIST